MHRRSFMPCALALLAALVAGPSAVRAQQGGQGPRPSAAVIAVEIAEAFAGQRRLIEDKLVLGLEASGLAVVGPADSRRRLADKPQLERCGQPSCWQELAQAVGAPLVARALVTSPPAVVPAGAGRAGAARRYAITLELDDTRDGQPLARQTLVCRPGDPCPSLAAHVQELARELGRKGRRALETKATAAAAQTAASEPAKPEPPVLRATPPAAGPVAPGKPRQLLPWLVIGTGVALVATGVGVYALDGHELGCARSPDGNRACQRLFNGRTPGAVVGAVGLTLAGAGLGWLWLRSSLRVSLSPENTTLQYSARF